MPTHGCAGPELIRESPLSFVTAVHLLGFGETTGMPLYENIEVPFVKKRARRKTSERLSEMAPAQGLLCIFTVFGHL